MALARDAVLKQAEKLIRQGKLDGAIEEYVRLVEEQPRDWASINALGDLYARVGAVDRAVAQFTRIADHLFSEGFLPKAAALYKKALKTKGDDEHTLLRLAEVAGRQGLLADARAYLRQLAKQRRDRGDENGALECQIKLAMLDDADPDAQMAGGRAALSLNNIAHAVQLYKEAARGFEKRQRPTDALEAMAEAARLDPSDQELRAQLVREYVALGQLDRAGTFLTRESAGDDPELLLILGRIELAAGRAQEGRVVLTRLLTVAPDRRGAVLAVAEEIAAGGDVDVAYDCAGLVVDDAVLNTDWDAAIEALRSFVVRVPHIPALIKLVEIAVDAGRDDVMRDAQARLTDAYLEAGLGADARGIAEDLVAHDPSSERHVQRLRRALELAGASDVEAIIAKYSEPAESFDELDGLMWEADGAGSDAPRAAADARLFASDEAPAVPNVPPLDSDAAPIILDDAPASPDAQLVAPDDSPADLAASLISLDEPLSGNQYTPIDTEPEESAFVETVEIDLSDVLASLAAPERIAAAADRSPDLEEVFEGLRGKAEREQQVAEALDQFERGVDHLEHGRQEQAIAELRNAVRTPILRFPAAARLGRLHLSRGEVETATEWLERAAEAPAPSQDEGLMVLYELASGLEQLGESARALAILMEIDAEKPFRDVPRRIEQLRLEAGGRA